MLDTGQTRGRADPCPVNMLTCLPLLFWWWQGISQNTESPTMSRVAFPVAFPVALLLLFPVQAEAHRRHYGHQRFLSVASFVADNQSDERTVGNRPSGCPRAFCGCEASLFRFGRIIPQLNLAANWRRFPRTAPAPGMAAVRSGHVMILQQQVAGNVWFVHDGNSGGHVTREHPRSIAGYTIVDPSSASWAQAGL
jgi:hypothetical protein